MDVLVVDIEEEEWLSEKEALVLEIFECDAELEEEVDSLRWRSSERVLIVRKRRVSWSCKSFWFAVDSSLRSCMDCADSVFNSLICLRDSFRRSRILREDAWQTDMVLRAWSSTESNQECTDWSAS